MSGCFWCTLIYKKLKNFFYFKLIILLKNNEKKKRTNVYVLIVNNEHDEWEDKEKFGMYFKILISKNHNNRFLIKEEYENGTI